MSDPLLSVAVLKVLSDHTKDRYEAARQDAATQLGEGDRRIVRSPLGGAKLGAVYMTEPKDRATIAHEDELVAWLKEHNYRSLVRTDYEIAGTTEQVVATLFEHAPHLLKKVTKVTSAARKELLSTAESIGEPVGPGGETEVPGIVINPSGKSYVACKPDPDALLAVYELFNSGRVALDGTVRELEASDGGE